MKSHLFNNNSCVVGHDGCGAAQLSEFEEEASENHGCFKLDSLRHVGPDGHIQQVWNTVIWMVMCQG